MNEELIQSLNAYTTALEQRLSALEQRVTLLEGRLSANSQTDQSVTSELENLQHSLQQLQTNHAAMVEKFEAMKGLSEPITTEEEPAVLATPSIEEEATPVPQPEEQQATSPAAPEPKHEDKPQPTQTSLFGAAVQDIRQAISLGDRFLFQRELFDGNGEKMQKTLDEINTLDTLDEALAYVREHFDWDKDTHAAQLFENILRRRF